MNTTSKLKQANWNRIIVFCILAIAVFLTGFAIIRTSFSDNTANKISGIIYLILTVGIFIGFIKTRNTIFIPVILLNMTISISFFMNMEKAMIIPSVVFLVICAYMLYFYLKHISIKKKILELAARPVEEIQSGFTGRPYPVRAISFSKGEIHGFSLLMKRLCVAVPNAEKIGISFTLSDDWFGRLYNINDKNISETRILFQYDGTVTVSISRNDYKKYKNELTFDQLCSSMGELFIHFFDIFNKGEGDKIVTIINKMDFNLY